MTNAPFVRERLDTNNVQFRALVSLKSSVICVSNINVRHIKSFKFVRRLDAQILCKTCNTCRTTYPSAKLDTANERLEKFFFSRFAKLNKQKQKKTTTTKKKKKRKTRNLHTLNYTTLILNLLISINIV